jgi:hypothetical protein
MRRYDLPILRGRWRALSAAGVILVSAGLAWLLSMSHVATLSLDPASIRPEQGNCYTALPQLEAPFPFGEVEWDDTSGPTQSSGMLYEDGRPLGPPHALHDAIRTQGRGQFSLWSGTLYFSASDNSDPRTNGRAYGVRYQAGIAKGVIAGVVLLDVILLLILNPIWLFQAIRRQTARISATAWLRAVGAAAFVISALLIAIPLMARVKTQTLDAVSIHPVQGNAYAIALDLHAWFPFVVLWDTPAHPHQSAGVVFENGRPLGPAHSQYADIRMRGDGRYSFWTGAVYFSASDNSDPHTNGRVYSVTYVPTVPLFLTGFLALLDALLIALFIDPPDHWREEKRRLSPTS